MLTIEENVLITHTGAGTPRTAEVFKALVVFAKLRHTPTYTEVEQRSGVHHRHQQHQLDAIWDWCKSKGLPHPNAIVVRAGEMKPGLGYPCTSSEFEAMKERVCDWDATEFPGA